MHITKFDNMPKLVAWYNQFRRINIDQIAPEVFEPNHWRRTATSVQESFAPFAELLDWIPTIHDLQNRKTHDIVAMTSYGPHEVWVTCSCGLHLQLPDQLARTYRRPQKRFLFTFEARKTRHDRTLEDWFYWQSGHSDPLFGSDGRCFIAKYATPSMPPRRRIICQACGSEMEHRHFGGTSMYNPANHRKQVEWHLAECPGVEQSVDGVAE